MREWGYQGSSGRVRREHFDDREQAEAALQQARDEQNEKPARAEVLRPEADQIALELHAWEHYVMEFIQTYDLDEGQRTAALSCLAELKERATAHRDRRREEITALERRIRNNSGTDQELAEIKQRLIKLYGPIDEMFKELKRRLESIPTAEQQAAVQE